MAPNPSSKQTPPKRKTRRPRKKNFVCPICRKHFATNEARTQHTETTHSSPTTRVKSRRSPRYTTKTVRGMANSPADAQLIEDAIGMRGGGPWVMKGLDPCADSIIGGTRIPDQTIGRTVAFEYKDDILVTAPSGVTADLEWDCLILQLPIPEMPYLICKKKSTDTAWLYRDLSDANTLGVSLPSLNYAKVRSNQLSTPWRAETEGATLGQICTAFRTTFKGVSVVFDAPDLHNEGRVYSGNIRTEITTAQVEIVDESGVTSTYNHPSYIIDKIPVDERALISVCPEMMRAKAREGAYLPARFMNQAHDYSKCSWEPIAHGDLVAKTRFLGKGA